MDSRPRALTVGVLLLIAVAIAVPASAADVVAFDARASGLTWKPLVAFEHGGLRIATPDGLVFQQEFGPGSAVTFNPFGQSHYRPPDGTYTWEISLGRPSLVPQHLRASAKAGRGDGDPDVEAMSRAAFARATLVQSGAFQIVKGAIVPSNLAEPGTGRRGAGGGTGRDRLRPVDWSVEDPRLRQVDQVIPDDLIVQGSLCVGLDCVNNESFGFDTIRLKENNTRIRFDDTSTATGFPVNDWQLTANDSASGGAGKFSIEDISGAKIPFTIRAGAATNSIFVDGTGRLGLRTATPVLDVHVATSNTPAYRLEQNNSGGFTAQTWDIAGNEANFFVRDVTGGSRLPFRIRPGAPTSSIDISASGSIGIGTASPSALLTVSNAFATTNVTPIATMNATGSRPLFVGETSGYKGVMIGFYGNDIQGRIGPAFGNNGNLALNHFGGNVGIGTLSPVAQLHTTGTVRFAALPNCAAGIITSASGDLSCATSSRHFKHVTGDLEPRVAVANVMALRPQVGSYKDTPHVPEHWLLAEETAAVDPALVGLADGRPYTVKTQNVVADLVAVVQQQQRRIEEQQRVIEEQHRRLDVLEQAARR